MKQMKQITVDISQTQEMDLPFDLIAAVKNQSCQEIFSLLKRHKDFC